MNLVGDPTTSWHESVPRMREFCTESTLDKIVRPMPYPPDSVGRTIFLGLSRFNYIVYLKLASLWPAVEPCTIGSMA